MLPVGTSQLGPNGERGNCTISTEGDLLGGIQVSVTTEGRERDTPMLLRLDQENALQLLRSIASALIPETRQSETAAQ